MWFISLWKQDTFIIFKQYFYMWPILGVKMYKIMGYIMPCEQKSEAINIVLNIYILHNDIGERLEQSCLHNKWTHPKK